MVFFTIVVPVYNVAPFLEETLNSIVNQSFPNYEVILVNDGSSDDSGLICEQYCKNDKRFKYVEQENQGLSVARNTGMSIAQGEYIYFFDSDDLLVPSSLEKWYCHFQKFECDAILFSASSFGEIETAGYTPPKYLRKILTSPLIDSTKYVAECLGNDAYFVSACMYVCKRTVLEGSRFYPSLIHEDELFFAELFAIKPQKIFIDEAIYFHRRVRTGSIMSSTALEKRYNSYLIIFERLLLQVDCLKKMHTQRILLHIVRNLAVIAAAIGTGKLVPRKYRQSLLAVLFTLVRLRVCNWKIAIQLLVPELCRLLK